MHHSLNGTRLVSGLTRTNEIAVLTVGTPPPRYYITIASRNLFLAESTGRQTSGCLYLSVLPALHSPPTLPRLHNDYARSVLFGPPPVYQHQWRSSSVESLTGSLDCCSPSPIQAFPRGGPGPPRSPWAVCIQSSRTSRFHLLASLCDFGPKSNKVAT